ncbi:hypothetical protein E2C01_041005 [Portunus trituberculatus]|uniref:Uncharacterized protein n=1 Tax=Portunus trituberculatus TaxID=210409 RepID=A0A5B7FSB2_PORTR|nr:hypothetical protein [Portunus trituberculatus]
MRSAEGSVLAGVTQVERQVWRARPGPYTWESLHLNLPCEGPSGKEVKKDATPLLALPGPYIKNRSGLYLGVVPDIPPLPPFSNT